MARCCSSPLRRCFLVGIDGRVSRFEGALLCLSYAAYLWFVARTRRSGNGDELATETKLETRTSFSILRIIAGLGVLLLGSKLVVDHSIELAAVLGAPQSLIGILFIGVGTSLPELSVAVTGMRRRAAGISLGLLIGSNITDPLLSLGSGAVIAGFRFDLDLLAFDIPFWLLSTLIALMLLRRRGEIGVGDRKEGALLVILFAAYVALKLGFDW